VIRLSHGIGLPPRWPDLLGMRIKLVDVHGPDRDQDLLLVSVGAGRFDKDLLRPARDYRDVTLSTVLPYRVAGVTTRIVARVGPTANPARYADIVRIGPHAVPLFNVHLGGATGPRLARVLTTDRLPEDDAADLRFNPWNTGPELEPIGRVHALRRRRSKAQGAEGSPSATGHSASRNSRRFPKQSST
jgi:hypothetical protein